MTHDSSAEDFDARLYPHRSQHAAEMDLPALQCLVMQYTEGISDFSSQASSPRSTTGSSISAPTSGSGYGRNLPAMRQRMGLSPSSSLSCLPSSLPCSSHRAISPPSKSPAVSHWQMARASKVRLAKCPQKSLVVSLYFSEELRSIARSADTIRRGSCGSNASDPGPFVKHQAGGVSHRDESTAPTTL